MNNLIEKIKNIQPKRRLFHNVLIDTYETILNVDEIKFWPENFRTSLDFKKIENDLGKNLKDITPEELLDKLVKLPEHKITDLAGSIQENGVRVPLIVLSDNTLLDGNRRYFACLYLKKRKNSNKELLDIPVWVIKNEDIDNIKKQKVLAEFNYVNDYKLPWPNDVKAMVVKNYFDECLLSGKTEDEAYIEIKDIYGIKKANVKEYIETIDLTKEFINTAEYETKKEIKKRKTGLNEKEIEIIRKEKEFWLKGIVLKKYVYFWEFRNKAYAGQAKLEDAILEGAKSLFFKMIKNERFKNIKQIYPMIRAYRDEDLRKILQESVGTKLDNVILELEENKSARSVEDRLRSFNQWLAKQSQKDFNKSAKNTLVSLLDNIKKFIQE